MDSPTTEELMGLRNSGLTRQQIADKFGVSLSQVKRWIADMNVEPRRNKRSKRGQGENRPRYASLDEGVPLMEKAKQILGPRLQEDHRGYLLDGRPVSSWKVVEAAKLR